MKRQLIAKSILQLMCGVSALAVTTAYADYASTVLSFNPSAYWRLNETTQPPPGDVATNSGTLGASASGLYLSGATHPTSGPLLGGSDNAASFPDAAGNRVRVPYNAGLAVAGPFSVEFWASPANTSSGDSSTMCPVAFTQFGNPPGNGDGTRMGWLFYQNGDTGWTFRAYGNGNAGFNATGNMTVSVGSWYHIVGVYDGANVILYVNGQQAASVAASSFVPAASPFVPFSIGARGDGALGFFRYNGSVDEVAYYTNVLSAADVLAHYQNGVNPAPSTPYSQLVQAKHPAAYYRLDEPTFTAPDASTFPVAANLGTLGAAANAAYTPGSLPGSAGAPNAGFGAANYACAFTPGLESGYVNAGNPEGLVADTAVTLMAWVQEAPGDTRFQTIFAKGDANGSWRLQMTGEGFPTFGTRGLDNMDLNGSTPINDGKWHHIVCVYDGAQKYLYVDGELANSIAVTGTLSTSGDPFAIGANTDYGGRVWSGAIDEVAIFMGTALTAAQVQQVYFAAGIAPVITQQPQSPGTINDGGTASLTVAAQGSPALTYQWTREGTNLTGQTTATLTLSPAHMSDSGNYAVIVTNPYGSATSSVVALTVQGGRPTIVQEPAPVTRYAGGTATFSVIAGGTAPLSYQWKRNGTDVTGANGSAYTISSVQDANAGTYTCAISNAYGNTNTAGALLTVLAVPAGGYAAAVIADNPQAFFRLDETNGTIAYDYLHDVTGQYTNATFGAPGCSALDPDTAVAFGPGIDSYLAVPSLDFSAGTAFSIEAWVKGGPQSGDVAVFAKGTGSGGEQVVLDTGNGGNYRFAVRDASGNWNGANASVGPNQTWQHLVAVFDPASGTTYLYVNGQQAGTGKAPTGGLLRSSRPFTIGARQSGSGPYDFNWFGSIDEVAIYASALNDSQVLAHYAARYGLNTAPIITRQPVATSNYVGLAASFSVEAGGSDSLSYQWRFNNSDIAGATDASLIVPALDATKAGNYSVAIANSVGNTNSTTVKLTVLPAPTALDLSAGLVAHLKFDTDYLDCSGRGNNGTNVGATTLVGGKVGPKALHYSTDADASSYNYVTLGLRPDLQFSTNVDFSVAYWIRYVIGSTFPGDLPVLGNAQNSTWNTGYVFAQDSGHWLWTLTGSGASTVAANATDTTVSDQNWHHLAFTFDRNGVGTTYLDGLAVDVHAIAGRGNLDSGQPTVIGQDPTGRYGVSAEADLDDLGIWRRVLSASEVAAMVAAGNNGLSFDTGPGRITIQSNGNQFQLLWKSGTLQSADDVSGTYTDVSGATSPYPVTPSAAKKFYRVRQ